MVDDLKKTLPGHGLVKIAPDQGKRFPVGRSSRELSRKERAVPLPVEGQESPASSPDFHYFTGLARYQRGMTDSAVMHFQQAIMCGTNKVSCLLMIARCQMKKGNFPEAKRCLVTGLSQEGISQTESIALRHQLGKCLAAMANDGQDRAEAEAEEGKSSRRYMTERVDALNQRLETIRRKHTPIANAIAEFKRTDPAVICEGGENARTRSIAVQLAATVAAIGAILVISYLTTVHNRRGVDEMPDPKTTINILAGHGESPVPGESKRPRAKPPSPAHFTLKVDVLTTRVVYAMDQPVLVVRGDISNLSGAEKVGIVVEGELQDGRGNLLSRATAPCGKISSYDLIEQTDPAHVELLYQHNGILHECSIEHGDRQRFQLIFLGISEDLGHDFSLVINPKQSLVPYSYPG